MHLSPRAPRLRGAIPIALSALVAAVLVSLLGTGSGGSLAPVSQRSATTGPTRGLLPGHMTAVGDSVMVDYTGALEHDLPGIDVEAAVSRQWSAGIAEIHTLRAEDHLGTTLIVGLGTNGPITDSDFQALMTELGGVQRVVFVTVYVDRPWQATVNAALRWGAARHHNVRIADWASLAGQHPNWLYSDGTHLPIGGAGAVALAGLVASAVRGP